ncbi:hypothetical protein PoB_001945500 [Plakobranchus ocellatus]|uniref:Uncharacterized protein n=1 Tax=Plakobranchus ocellatus TaxID=259542 RepID=A0AAV3ZEE8_9GAST|nr:hypothetical protein PoB_001945500 [Plakobranchus ocellatus]
MTKFGARVGAAMPELMLNGGGGQRGEGGIGGGAGGSCGGGLTFDAIAGREEEAVVVDYILNKCEYS